MDMVVFVERPRSKWMREISTPPCDIYNTASNAKCLTNNS